jgi:carbonic anhydrase
MISDNPISFSTNNGKIAKADIDSALQKLIEGNKRYLNGKSIHPNQTESHRSEIANNPRPFAIILSCSDSRVPPEIIFDRGIGDLFVVRNAGNILNDEVLGSIEYAVDFFGIKLIVVMGHSRCGAVSAAVQGGEFPGHIKRLVESIMPAVEKAKCKNGDIVQNAVNENIIDVVEKLKFSEPILKQLVNLGKINFVGACYDMDNGNVTFRY